MVAIDVAAQRCVAKKFSASQRIRQPSFAKASEGILLRALFEANPA
jgi:hypothetical protein